MLNGRDLNWAKSPTNGIACAKTIQSKGLTHQFNDKNVNKSNDIYQTIKKKFPTKDSNITLTQTFESIEHLRTLKVQNKARVKQSNT